jgi:hypothetical protein
VSDARARDAERTAGVDVEAEARALVERMRAGSITWDEVALDAYLGHAPAQLALGEAVEPVPLGTTDDVILWLRGFAAWGRDVRAKGFVAWLRAGLRADDAGWTDAVRARWAAIDRGCHTGDAVPTTVASPEGRPSWCARVAGEVLALSQLSSPMSDRVTLTLLERTLTRPPGRAWAFDESPRDAASVRALLRAWPLAATPTALRPGPTLRARVLDTTTPPSRRRVVALLRERVGQRVTLRRAMTPPWEVTIIGPVDFETTVVQPSSTGVQQHNLELDTVVDVLPPGGGFPDQVHQ